MASIRCCIVLIIVVLLTGCGSDKNSGATSTGSPVAATTSTTTADDQPPAPTVRSFLAAYQSGKIARACGLVGAGFSNPRNRTLRTPASCRAPRHGKKDVLAQPQQIVASDPAPPTARVVTLNAKRTQLLYELKRRGGRWRITLVKPVGRLAKGRKATVPAP
jgi:hypothetical protein